MDVHLTFPFFPRFLELCRRVTHSQLQHSFQHRESSTRCLWCVQLSPDFEPFLFGTRCTSVKRRPVVSVANKAYSVWLNVRMSTEGLASSRWDIRHRLRSFVLQMLYVPLVYKSEVVLELETELSSFLYGVGLAIKFQDFHSIRSHCNFFAY